MASTPAQAPPEQAEPGAAQAPDADSDVDSNATKEWTAEGCLQEIHELRERKLSLCGRLSRPIKEYCREDVVSRLHPPRPGMFDDIEESYYNTYLDWEHTYWHHEVRAWEGLLKRIQRDWEKRNDAAGGTVPPPPPLREMDPLELHTEYLELVQSRLEAATSRGGGKVKGNGWFFHSYRILVEHYEAMKRVVEEMRNERNQTVKAATQEKHRDETRASSASASHSGAKKRKRTQDDDSDEDATPRAAPAPKKTRTQKKGAPAPKKQTARGARTTNSTSTPAAEAADVPSEPAKTTRRGPGKKEVQAKIIKKSELVPKKSRARAPAAEAATERVRKGKNITSRDQPSGSPRRSRRRAGLEPENDGL